MSMKEIQNNFEKDFTLSINKDTVKEQGAFGIKGGAFKALLSSNIFSIFFFISMIPIKYLT